MDQAPPPRRALRILLRILPHTDLLLVLSAIPAAVIVWQCVVNYAHTQQMPWLLGLGVFVCLSSAAVALVIWRLPWRLYSGTTAHQANGGRAPLEGTMSDPLPTLPPISDRSGVTDAVRAQILATEHWSLLATRSLAWNEVFSRASMFITVLSAAVVALALVAQATAFGPGFRLFALLVLPLVLLVGLATVIRLSDANTDDLGLVVGMNRLRHAYLELAPELEPYFVTGHYDDMASVLRSYGLGYRSGLSRALSATPNLVAAINVVVVGVLAALIAQTLGAPDAVNVVVGVVAALAAAVGYGALSFRAIRRARRLVRPRFPG